MEGVLEAFITLFVIMDPVGNLPVFTSLTKGMPLSEVKRNADRSVLVAGILLFIFLFLGLKIFDFFGIDMNSFQIAGGIILMIIGIIYVFGLSGKLVKANSNDLSVPIGTPLLTGPGVITTTIILVKENGPFVTVIAAFLTLFTTWIILWNASKLYKLLGEHWTNIISRVMGIVVAAIAVKFIMNGIINSIGAVV